MKRIKVLQVISHFELGGAERVAINIAKSRNEQFSYHVVEVQRGCSAFSFQLMEEMERAGIVYHRSPIKYRKLAIVLFPLWFAFLYLRIRPDVIHAHTEIPDLSLWLFRKTAWLFPWICPRYIRTIHSTKLWNEWKQIGRMVEPFYMKHHCNVAISRSTCECYRKEWFRCEIPIIYNGAEELTQKTFPNLYAGKVNILFAGRFEEEKGYRQLTSIIKSFGDDSRYFFHLVGSGPGLDFILSELKENNNYKIYDKIYGLASYLGSFDYLLMPSNFEGLGLMSIEASLAKTPPIINLCAGLDETVPEDWPLAVEGNSVDEYIRIFKTVLPNVLSEELGEKAYSYVKEKFSIRKMQNEYEFLYVRGADKIPEFDKRIK